MLKYGTDKPDLRNPLVIADVTEVFAREDVTFNAFKNVIRSGGVVRAIPAPGAARAAALVLRQAQRVGARGGRAGPRLRRVRGRGRRAPGKGPIAKFIPAEAQAAIARQGRRQGRRRGVLRLPASRGKAATLAGKARVRIGDELGLVDKDQFGFCWIVDFPMYEWNEDEKKIDFSHNPFSMPNTTTTPSWRSIRRTRTRSSSITAFQYDIVCNGVELSSGAIRNHRPTS